MYNTRCKSCGKRYNEESNYSDVETLRNEAKENGWSVIPLPDDDECIFFCPDDKCQKKMSNDYVEFFPYEVRKTNEYGKEIFIKDIEYHFTNKRGEDIYKGEVVFRRGHISLYTYKYVWVKSKKTGFVINDSEYENGELTLEKKNLKKE